jgi:hypothetical protein
MHDLQGPYEGDVANIAQRNLRSGHELAMVSGEVIARRFAMGVSGMLDPANANHAELARLLPEKAEASSASAMAILGRSAQLAERMTKFVTDEMLLAARDFVSLASCRTPAAFVAVHQGLTFSWLARLMAHGGAIGVLAGHSQSAAVAPFHKAATANAARLAGE